MPNSFNGKTAQLHSKWVNRDGDIVEYIEKLEDVPFYQYGMKAIGLENPYVYHVDVNGRFYLHQFSGSDLLYEYIDADALRLQVDSMTAELANCKRELLGIAKDKLKYDLSNAAKAGFNSVEKWEDFTLVELLYIARYV